jgi:hypothetical protein
MTSQACHEFNMLTRIMFFFVFLNVIFFSIHPSMFEFLVIELQIIFFSLSGYPILIQFFLLLLNKIVETF